MTREELTRKRLARLKRESERRIAQFRARAERIMAKSAKHSFVSDELAERMKNGGQAG